MKKYLFLLLLVAFLAPRAKSQVLIALLFGDALNSENISFGLTGGATVSNLTSIDPSNYKPSFNLGLFFDFKLAKNFYLHPEAIVKSNMGANGLLPYTTSDSSLTNLLEDATVARKINYINVPIMAKYRWPKGWGIELGPQLSLRTKARDEFKTGVGAGEELILTIDLKDQIKRLDAGVAAGLSKRLHDGRGALTIQGRFYYGLMDIYKENQGAAVRNMAFYINVNIPIGVGKAEKKEQEKEAE